MVSQWLGFYNGEECAVGGLPTGTVNGFAADTGTAGAAFGPGAVLWLPNMDCVGVLTAGAMSAPPDSNARSVCATRAASALRKYTMNMLPPARCGVSSCQLRFNPNAT
jgi:hypothetical protein